MTRGRIECLEVIRAQTVLEFLGRHVPNKELRAVVIDLLTITTSRQIFKAVQKRASLV